MCIPSPGYFSGGGGRVIVPDVPRIVFAVVVAALSTAPLAGAQDGIWWRNPAMQRAVGLSPGQISNIERIYDSTLSERRTLRARLDQAEGALADALAQGTLTDAEARVLIDHVNDARTRRNVARTALLVRIYHVLTPEQRRTLTSKQRSRR